MTNSSQGQAEGDIRLMMDIGLILCGSPATQRLRKVYLLPLFPDTVPPPATSTQIDLSEKRRDILLQLMDAFPSTSFSTRDASLLIGSAQSTISYHLDALSKLGILNVTKNTAGSKLFMFSDDAHGIFQAIKGTGDDVAFRRMAVEKTEYSPLQGTAEAG